MCRCCCSKQSQCSSASTCATGYRGCKLGIKNALTEDAVFCSITVSGDLDGREACSSNHAESPSATLVAGHELYESHLVTVSLRTAALAAVPADTLWGVGCMQEDLVRSYNLPFEVVGSDSDARLRILPQHYISGDNERVLGTEWDARSSGWHTV